MCEFCKLAKKEKEKYNNSRSNDKYYLTHELMSSINVSVDLGYDGMFYIIGYGDDVTDKLFITYCPECGTKLS